MFSIDNTTHKINLTKGDDAEIIVKVFDAEGNDRGVYADDTLKLTIRKSAGSAIVLSKTAIDGMFVLTPTDTKTLPSGNYVYDVELTSFTGKTYTIIPKSTFVLGDEITV